MTGALWCPRSRWLERRHAERREAEASLVDAAGDVFHARGGCERDAGVEDVRGLERPDRDLGGACLDVCGAVGIGQGVLLGLDWDGGMSWSRLGCRT